MGSAPSPLPRLWIGHSNGANSSYQRQLVEAGISVHLCDPTLHLYIYICMYGVLSFFSRTFVLCLSASSEGIAT